MGCAVVREIVLTAREALRHKALNKELEKLEMQERRDKEELASKIEELKDELEAARRTIAGHNQGVRRNEKNQDTKHGTAERETSSGSVESWESNGSLEVGGPAHRKEW